MTTLKIVAISDTHGGHHQVTVPDADVLIHCGDYCKYGQIEEVKDFAVWLKKLPHKHKLVVAGNHDKPVEQRTDKCRRIFKEAGVTLLLNEEVVIDGVKFWGSPITPTFLDWHFMKDRGPAIADVWREIPWDVDVLITHGPAYGHGDLCPPYRTAHRKVAGCFELLKRIKQIHVASGYKNPRIHVFGHIHDGYGATQSDEFGSLTFINASTCTERYKPTNAPVGFSITRISDGQGQDTAG